MYSLPWKITLVLVCTKIFPLEDSQGAGDINTSPGVTKTFISHGFYNLIGRGEALPPLKLTNWLKDMSDSKKIPWDRKVSIFLLRASSVASPPPLQGRCTCALIKSQALSPYNRAQLTLSHRIMDYRFIFLFLTIGSCTHNTGDSLLYCCLNLIVGVFPIVFLIPVVADEQTTETSEVYLPLLLSGFIILYIYTSVLLRVQGVFFCTYRLELICGSSAHRWNPYPPHRQVQLTLSSLSLKMGWLMSALSNQPCVDLFIPSPACAPFISSCYHPRRYLRCLPDGNPALTQVAVH